MNYISTFSIPILSILSINYVMELIKIDEFVKGIGTLLIIIFTVIHLFIKIKKN